MTIRELAKELRVPPPDLVAYLRSVRLPVPTGSDALGPGVASKVRARLEKERRASGAGYAKIVKSAVRSAGSPVTRRRKARKRVRAAKPEADPTTEADAQSEQVEIAPSEEEEPRVAASSSDGDTGSTETTRETPAADAAATDGMPSAEPRSGPAETAIVDDAASGRSASEVAADEQPRPTGPVVTEERAATDPTSTAPTQGPPASGAPESSTGVPPTPATGSGLRPAASGTPLRSPRIPRPAASTGVGGQVKVRASGYTSDGKPARKPGPKGRAAKRQSAQQAAKRNVSRIRGQMRGPGRKPRRRQRLTPDQIEERQRQEAAEQERRERERRTVRVAEFLSVAELAELVEETPAALIGSAFRNMGMMVTINQRLDFDQIEMLLDEFNFHVEREETLEVVEDIDPYGIDSETAEPRPPVVTVMGHVDHGKTLLLDRIRKANVVAGEAGGITQHIGAYHVQLPSGRVTFLDTPGHAAFTAMRARGADVTDIVILLVAADDSVMPQTVEAINHASSAGVPLVVAVNKCDLPGVDPDRVKRQLLQHSVQVDDLGGEVLSANVSAKTGKGIDDLLEQVLLQAELMEDKLRADPRRRAVCTVVEARLDVGKGPVVTVLVQGGTLRVGDTFVCGLHQGRVRAMHDERGMPVKEAGPSIPVQVLGAGGVPQAGDPLQVREPSRAQARVSELQQLDREKQMRLRERAKKIGDFAQLTQADGMIEVPILVKGDVDGSVQALADAFEQIGGEEDGVRVRIVHRGVGAINESDVLLAQTTEAVIIGFGVRPQAAARKQAEDAAVEIRTYDIIYKAVDDLTRSLEGRLSPDQVEHVEGSAQVRETFRVSKVGMIAGCYVVQGRVNRKFRIRVIREGKTVFEGEIASLRRFKDDAREVREGFECGIGIANFNDVKVGDEIECYTVEEIARKLAKAS